VKHIVTYSGGICSAYIAAQWQRDGKNPICVFSDTKREHPDTYRFAAEVADKFGLNVVNASDGRDMWEVFREWKMIPARQLAACSVTMKIKPSRAWLQGQDSSPGLVAYGYDIDEEDRAAKLLKNWTFSNLKPVFSLIEWNVSKQQCFGFFLEHGIKPPSIYEHFRNANCLPCKNFRRNDYLALLVFYPAIYADAENFEIETGLRWMQDDVGLTELRLEYERDGKRAKRRNLPMATPAFNFDMGCDRCALD
jgi:3'-phosphoadenosine 5'-phosphosulfate sulfotransferase (PAPS reductase)/FAD synthetase